MSQREEKVMAQPSRPSQPGEGWACREFLKSSRPSENMKSIRLNIRMI